MTERSEHRRWSKSFPQVLYGVHLLPLSPLDVLLSVDEFA